MLREKNEENAKRFAAALTTGGKSGANKEGKSGEESDSLRSTHARAFAENLVVKSRAHGQAREILTGNRFDRADENNMDLAAATAATAKTIESSAAGALIREEHRRRVLAADKSSKRLKSGRKVAPEPKRVKVKNVSEAGEKFSSSGIHEV